MHAGKLVFSQVMELLPWRRFETCVRRYDGDRKIKSFPCAEHLRVTAFAQLTYRERLRDIETCLHAVGTKLYHMGICGGVSRNNLSHANHTRDWRIYADFAQILIGQARSLYAEENLGIDLEATVYALDASTIDLCPSMFPWAKFRQAKGAVKLHTLLNLQGSIPEFILISDGKLHDVNGLDHLVPSPGAYYVMDRGHLDFPRLYDLHQAKADFVTRAKSNFRFKRRYSREVDKSTGVQCEQTVILETYYSFQGYPEPLRRIRYYDQRLDKRLVFLTNDFQLPPATIAALYKSRWQIELFFKGIKQHLRIKAFYGTSQNAVKAQIWIAVSVYLLVAIMKKRLGIPLPLYTILQMLSVSIFEKTPLVELFSPTNYKTQEPYSPNQLSLFD
ncbi:MAG: IS4 family transposase [Pyrinomonadaceae bacterium]|nr:IS4 family transposase [Pirellulales bacterium]MBA3572279.1 IS4 family transposase [Pyrinomonadaceae bacterium]